jgi:DNA primase
MAFPEIFLDELIRRNDIVDVVGSYVHLTKKSGNNMFGLCPFHSEKTPSFSVSADKQIYHCFGCGKGGGVVNFIMEIEHLSYPDAVHVLAKRSGMTVPDENISKETQSKRAKIFDINRDAARFFYSVLLTPQGEAARNYIAKRGISKAMVTRFGLGAAPDSWSALYEALTGKGYTRQELLDAGLVKLSRKGTDSVYDAFRNRLMFPVIDVRGSIIGFSGRILGDGEPKYLNSPDTLVFEKSRNLFALNLAKKTKSGMLILAEGNIDVVSLHQAGFDAAVASLGTSLTEEQVRLMSRYTQNVVIAYDADEAGVKASQRAIGLLEKAGLGVKVLRMHDAKDPDEFIKKFGPDAFSLLLERSEHRIDYRLLTIKAKYALDTDEGRLGYLNEATDMLSRLESAVEREIYAAKVGETAGVSAEAVKNEIKKAFKRRLTADKKRQDRKELNVAAGFQPGDKTIRYENVYSAAAEEGVIRLLVLDSALFEAAGRLEFSESEFTSPFLQKIFMVMKKRRDDGMDASPASILAELNSAEASRFSVIIQRPESLSNGEKAMRDYIDKIRAERLKKSAREDPLAVLQKYRDNSGCGG